MKITLYFINEHTINIYLKLKKHEIKKFINILIFVIFIKILNYKINDIIITFECFIDKCIIMIVFLKYLENVIYSLINSILPE